MLAEIPASKVAMSRRSAAPALLAAAFLVSLLSGCSQDGGASAAAPAPPPPPQVGVMTLHPQPVTLTEEVAGRVVAVQMAEIRPQAGGIIRERVYEEGTKVEAGQLLYRIDARSYRATLESAEAALAKAQAALPSAKARADRYDDLSNNQVVSLQDKEDAIASYRQAQADIASAQAAVDAATIDLEHTEIRAPMAGIIGTSSVDPGALVVAGQTEALATIRQLDTVYVDLTQSTGSPIQPDTASADGTEIRLTLTDGTAYPEVGHVEARERFVSETTSSFTIRTRFPNPNLVLMPGMYVRATITAGRERGFLVPQRAVSRNGRGQPTAYFVAADGNAEQRVLTVSTDVGPNWVVTDGIADGDRLIVDGLQKLQAGKAVTPTEVTLDPDGVVRPAGDVVANAGAAAQPTAGPKAE